jgi:hypothetical protein
LIFLWGAGACKVRNAVDFVILTALASSREKMIGIRPLSLDSLLQYNQSLYLVLMRNLPPTFEPGSLFEPHAKLWNVIYFLLSHIDS